MQGLTGCGDSLIPLFKMKRKPRKRIPMTFHQMRREIKKILPKGNRMAVTFALEDYCKNATKDGAMLLNGTVLDPWRTEKQMIAGLTTFLGLDNFQIIRLLPIVRKRRQYFKDKEQAWARDQRRREERSPFILEPHDEFEYISPGGTKKMVKLDGHKHRQ